MDRRPFILLAVMAMTFAGCAPAGRTVVQGTMPLSFDTARAGRLRIKNVTENQVLHVAEVSEGETTTAVRLENGGFWITRVGPGGDETRMMTRVVDAAAKYRIEFIPAKVPAVKK